MPKNSNSHKIKDGKIPQKVKSAEKLEKKVEKTEEKQRRSTLISRNIRIDRHRTSVRLEPIFWDILQHITKREKLSIHIVCTKVAERAPQLPLTGALRIFLIAYAWRAGMSSALEAVQTGKMEL